MSEERLAVRLRDRPGALERVIGLIRRRMHPVRRVSVAESSRGFIELMLRLAPGEAAVERVRADLVELYDVIEVDAGAAPPRTTRELALVRLRPDAAEHVVDLGRRITAEGGGIVLEITGAPEELDRALSQLSEQRLITGFVRSGEVAVPDDDPPPPRRET